MNLRHLTPGDQVTVLREDGSPLKQAIVTSLSGDYVVIFNPCTHPDCDCDPHLSVHRDRIRVATH